MSTCCEDAAFFNKFLDSRGENLSLSAISFLVCLIATGRRSSAGG